MARTQFPIGRSRSDASIVGGPTTAGWSSPTGVAYALSTSASSVIRAQVAFVPVTGEVVAFAVITRYYLQTDELILL